MQKDYLPVNAGESRLSETSFIEQFWSAKWREKELPISLTEKIEKREEFKLMMPYLAQLPPGSPILDGGCGLGEWTLYLAGKGFTATGLDLSREIIEKLQKRFPEAHFAAGDIRQTGFPDETFAAYFSWGTFEHFEDGFAKPLQEAHRIIKKGGKLFLTVPFQNQRHLRREQRPLWRWDEAFDRDRGYQAPLRFYQWRLTKPELQRELEMNGFSLLQIEAIQKRHGLRRMVQHDLHLDPKSFSGKVARVLLYPLVPKSYAAHMLYAAGEKIG
jgi:SAM-dependent methyltransferase